MRLNTDSIISTVFIETPIGKMTVAATDYGLCYLGFTDIENDESLMASLAEKTNISVFPGENIHLTRLKKELKEYFNGKRKNFDLSLDLQGSEFQMLVWNKLLDIPFGQTKSYAEQAKAAGRPSAVRAVANANALNPIAIIIPCHRIIGSDKQLTGYRGGLTRKRWLLEHEKKFSGIPVSQTLF